MTRLFGGFSQRFYDAYHEIWPLESGHEERVIIYNMYHLLNHANLFGGGYLSQAQSAMQRFI
jgi:fructosamine-3-kinase